MALGWTMSAGHALPPWRLLVQSLGGHSLGAHIYISTLRLGGPRQVRHLRGAYTLQIALCHTLLKPFDDDWSHM